VTRAYVVYLEFSVLSSTFAVLRAFLDGCKDRKTVRWSLYPFFRLCISFLNGLPLQMLATCFHEPTTGVWLNQRAQDTKWAKKMRNDFSKFAAAVRTIEAGK
jgi:hypothetical protein